MRSLGTSRLESRDYQNYIVSRIKKAITADKNVILELDCGMGKRVIIYRLLAEAFPEKKILVFLQNQSSLQETEDYLQNNYGGIEGLTILSSKYSSLQKKYIIENNRIILSLPLSFFNTIKKYPELISSFQLIVINEVDTIIRRVSNNNVLKNPWNNLFLHFKHCKFIGMSGTLRDTHVVSQGEKTLKKKELNTLLDFFPNSDIIYLEDLIETDFHKYVKYTEIFLYPVEDKPIKEILDFLTSEIEKIKETIKKEQPSHNLSADTFYTDVQYLDIDTDIIKKLNQLLILRKYVYSMPVSSFWKHLLRSGFSSNQLPPYPQKTGKEEYVLKIVQQHKKVVILCSYLSTIYSLKDRLLKLNYDVYIVEGKTRFKSDPLKNFKESDEKSVLLISSVGERDLDIPDTELLIVYDLVNSPKTVYQKMKRSRGGKVYILFYNDTSEQNKVRRVISNIVIKYPWSIVYLGEKKS